MIASGDGRSLGAAAAPSGGSVIRFKAGDLIVAADPLVHVLNPVHRNKRCDNCYGIRSELKKCSGCRLLRYCGRECQLEDWKSFHKHGECRLLNLLASLPHFDIMAEFRYLLLFLRTHLLLKAKPELMNQKFRMHDGTERSLADVSDDAEECGLHTDIFITTREDLQSVDQSNYPDENVPALLSLFHKIRKSFLFINRGDIGLGLYVPISGFKHSCRPNTSYILKGKRLEVRAMRDIAEGEDVTIDLVDVMNSEAGRQEELAEWRGILCDCDRCHEGDEEDEVSDHAANQMYRDFMLSSRRLLAPRVVFDGFMSLMEIKEKYQSRYHPDFVFSMYLAAITSFLMPYKTVKDKQNFDLLVEKLKETVPISYGLDSEVVDMQDLQMGDEIWVDLLP